MGVAERPYEKFGTGRFEKDGAQLRGPYEL